MITCCPDSARVPRALADGDFDRPFPEFEVGIGWAKYIEGSFDEQPGDLRDHVPERQSGDGAGRRDERLTTHDRKRKPTVGRSYDP